MKNLQYHLPFLLLGLLPFTACKNKCDIDNFGIQSIQPAANPAGYEIFIACTGVSASTKVRFDEVEAASVKTAEGGLIAKVPTGVTGPVSLSIEEGDCSDSKTFDVLGSYPGNVPASPTIIVIPQPPTEYIGSVSNAYKNLIDENHSFNVQTDGENPGHILPDDGASEFHFGGNSFLDQNPISGTYDTLANEIFMVIDRTSKPNGYKDTLEGTFIKNFPQTPTATATMLLTSKRTGRQLVIYKEF